MLIKSLMEDRFLVRGDSLTVCCCDGPSAKKDENDSEDGWDEIQFTSTEVDEWKGAIPWGDYDIAHI
jgi:hypothetical protein